MKILNFIAGILLMVLIAACVVVGLVLTPIRMAWEQAESNSETLHKYVNQLGKPKEEGKNE